MLLPVAVRAASACRRISAMAPVREWWPDCWTRVLRRSIGWRRTAEKRPEPRPATKWKAIRRWKGHWVSNKSIHWGETPFPPSFRQRARSHGILNSLVFETALREPSDIAGASRAGALKGDSLTRLKGDGWISMVM